MLQTQLLKPKSFALSHHNIARLSMHFKNGNGRLHTMHLVFMVLGMSSFWAVSAQPLEVKPSNYEIVSMGSGCS